MTNRKSEGALATLAYVRGWRQTDDGRWFKPGVAGTFQSASEAFSAEELKPGQRGHQLTCGCCAGPVEDRCCCHIHQDIPMGLRAHKCSLHS